MTEGQADRRLLGGDTHSPVTPETTDAARDIFTRSSTDSNCKSAVLRCRGLPFGAGPDEVRSFFGGYNLLEVVISKRQGDPGEWRLISDSERFSN